MQDVFLLVWQHPRLDPSWWRHFTADFTARMVSSTRPVRQAA